MPLVGDRVRLASRPHRSLRRLLRRRLFTSAPAHAPAAAGRALPARASSRHPPIPSLCTRPRRPPSSPPLVATLIAAAAGRPPSRLAAMIFPFAPSLYAAHNGVRNVIFSLENGRFEAKGTTNLSRGSAPHPVKMTFRLQVPDLISESLTKSLNFLRGAAPLHPAHFASYRQEFSLSRVVCQNNVLIN